ncbi:MAG: SDR family NAD(P)-dependent oxidoreductase [Clostridiaceae bacterium]
MHTVLITGATSGIGLASALELARNGFRILGIGRDQSRCELAKQQILNETSSAEAEFFCADLMQQREVHRVAGEIIAYLNESCGGELFALINNAGCVRSWHTTTEEGYEQQFALNHLAGFLLTYRLLPYLLKAQGRVLMTSSGSHRHMKMRWNDLMFRRGYHPLLAYKQSKLCNVLFAKGLNDRFAWQGLRAYAVDPGLVCTEIGCKNTGGLVDFVWKRRSKHGVSPEIPAKTYAYLCMTDSAPEGIYYYLSKEAPFSREVNWENAARLFRLSEQLCGIQYDERKENG